jgi:TonB family protein
MSQAFFHSLNIGTLAAWLSVAGFGTVGVFIHPFRSEPAAPPEIEETLLLAEDFTLGGDSSPASDAPEIETVPDTPPEPMPVPPEMPALAEIEPLPVIPEFAARSEPPAETAPRSEPRPTVRSGTSARKAGSPAGKTATSTQKGSGTPGAGGSGMSTAARLAAGRMPPPTYPPYSRRNGQTGTVIVEFTVDSTGRVVSAYAKSPSPWPLLNAEAISTVRSWRFPPGGVMKLQRPIVFQIR